MIIRSNQSYDKKTTYKKQTLVIFDIYFNFSVACKLKLLFAKKNEVLTG